MKRADDYLANIKRTVLIVDDEEIRRKELGRILEQDYSVFFAENGEGALRMIEANEDTLSLIILDLHMPGMDGLTLLDILHTDGRADVIPVITLAGGELEGLDSVKKGASDFLVMPVRMPEKVKVTVGRIIGLSEDREVIRATELDELTGLYSMNYFFEYAQIKDKYMPDRNMDAVTLNVNDFHLYVEMYGMNAGNKVLRRIGEIVDAYASDNGGIAARSDCDNFSIYLPHKDSLGELVKLVETGIKDDPEVFNVTFRLGVNTRMAGSKEKLETVFNRARDAAESLRGMRGSAIAYYDSEMASHRVFDEKLSRDIADAIGRGEIEVVYQPKYDITTSEPVLNGAEALVRWRHPKYGMLFPGSFIHLFEQNGLIKDLDTFVWKQAALQIRKWKDSFNISLPVSVNVSRIDLQDENIDSVLSDIVNEAGIDTGELHLEIAESAYISDSERLSEVLKRFREKGFVVEIDDFGRGYSSLNMLTSLPADILKVDMDLISNISENKRSKKLMELILDIARFLKMPVVVEGVEAKEHFETLKNLDCDMIQGYYFSRPVVAEEFVKFVKD